MPRPRRVRRVSNESEYRVYQEERARCERKVRYHSWETANEGRQQAQRYNPRIFRVYQCDFCGGWHLTTK